MPLKKNKSTKFPFLIGGIISLVVGITLVLVCWEDVVLFFRGVTGMVLAIGGLVLMVLAKE